MFYLFDIVKKMKSNSNTRLDITLIMDTTVNDVNVILCNQQSTQFDIIRTQMYSLMYILDDDLSFLTEACKAIQLSSNEIDPDDESSEFTYCDSISWDNRMIEYMETTFKNIEKRLTCIEDKL